MEMNDGDLYRTVVGMMALTYRETHSGSGYKSEESRESLALLTDLGGFKLELEFHKDEDLAVLLLRAGQQVADAAGLRMARALSTWGFAFAEFCDLVKQELPSIDIEALLGRMALRAAQRFGPAG
jgi:hypothetical protein